MDQHLPPRALSGAPVDPLPPGLYPARSPLEGRHARLEPLDARLHAHELWAASHGSEADERLWDYMSYGPFDSFETFQRWLRERSAEADPVFYAIRDGRNGQASGMVSHLNIRPKDGVIEIGHIWFGRALQNSRESTEALYLMMRYALDGLGYRRLEWKCDALNQPSRNAAQRLGFAFEGIFYRHIIVKGHNRDTAWFSIIDSEWPAIRTNFEAWLAPENFNGDGRQIRSLGAMNRALRDA